MEDRYSANSPINDVVIKLAEKLWDYHHMHHQLRRSDCILALGSHDLRVAERAADLWLQGWAPYIVFSGGLGNLTSSIWKEPEADQFAAVAIKMGVPQNVIYVENRSTNTGENIHFSRELLLEKGLNPQHLILVQKPYMERRTYATVKKVWPEKDIIITSPQFSLLEYPIPDIPLSKVIHIMVGDLQRIHLYPSRGFQVYQEIPDDVWNAYEQLVQLGFTGHLAN